MRKTILFAVTCCLLQATFAARTLNSVAIPPFALLVQPQIKLVPKSTEQKSMTLKEKLLLKWYTKKTNRNATEDKQKNNVKMLGLLSIFAGVLGLFAAALAFIYSVFGVFLAISFTFCLIAITLGCISLKRRKKLTDKTGTSKIPALIGIILGSLSILLPIIYLVLFSLVYE